MRQSPLIASGTTRLTGETHTRLILSFEQKTQEEIHEAEWKDMILPIGCQSGETTRDAEPAGVKVKVHGSSARGQESVPALGNF